MLVRAQGTNRLFLGDLRGPDFLLSGRSSRQKADLAIDLANPIATCLLSTGSSFIRSSTTIGTFTSAMSAKRRAGRLGRLPVHGQPDRSARDRSGQRASHSRVLRGGHNGGCLVFGNDGYLYISTGDGADPSPPDPLLTGQDCSDLLSSMLRLDVDHPRPGKAYRVPHDNPFVHVPGVRPEVWAYGFRNPWKMSIDRATGDCGSATSAGNCGKWSTT